MRQSYPVRCQSRCMTPSASTQRQVLRSRQPGRRCGRRPDLFTFQPWSLPLRTLNFFEWFFRVTLSEMRPKGIFFGCLDLNCRSTRRRSLSSPRSSSALWLIASCLRTGMMPCLRPRICSTGGFFLDWFDWFCAILIDPTGSPFRWSPTVDFSCFSEEGTKCVHKLARFCAQVTPEDKGKATRLHSQEKKLGLGT